MKTTTKIGLLLLLSATTATAAPMRYELDLTPTADHEADSWDHNVPLTGPFDCDGACHTGAAGDLAPSGRIDTPAKSGIFLRGALAIRYYGDSSNVAGYPSSGAADPHVQPGQTFTAQGYYLSGGRATVAVPLASARFLHAQSVSVGQNVCAVSMTGELRCWGRNRFGGLGNGTDQDSNLPVETIGLPSAVRQVAAFYRNSCAVNWSGSVWCWGSNYYGELGNALNIGDDSNSTPNGFPVCSGTGVHWGALLGGCFEPTPTKVAGLPGPVASVTVGNFFTCARLWAGSVWCWGGNSNGQLGNGTTANSSVPVQVKNLSGVTAVSAGASSVCALRSDRTVWCWGSNSSGQLGNGTPSDSSVPVPVTGLSDVTGVSLGYASTCALRSDDTVWCWGDNSSGGLGIGSTSASSLIPVQVTALSGITQISLGQFGACALGSDRKVSCWGWYLGTTTDTSVPVPVTSLSDVMSVSTGYSSVCALRLDRTAWCWGDNGWGALGNPVAQQSVTPVPVYSIKDRKFMESSDPEAEKFGDRDHYSIRKYTGSFDPTAGLFVATDNPHHSIGIGSGWGSTAFAPTYPGGILSNEFTCSPGNPDDSSGLGCGSNPSVIDSYDLRTSLPPASGHKLSNAAFPESWPASSPGLPLIGGGTIKIDPISPTDNEHASVGYLGSFTATALTPMSALSVKGGASGATATAGMFVHGTFALGAGGKPFNPATDDLVFGFGPYTAYLAAGTLQRHGSGAIFLGAVNGSQVGVSIEPQAVGGYRYNIAAYPVDLSHWVGPARFDLYVGDNAGSAIAGTPPP
jgi:alpha-tubulin suppressor-like RCC1 family protein